MDKNIWGKKERIFFGGGEESKKKTDPTFDLCFKTLFEVFFLGLPLFIFCLFVFLVFITNGTKSVLMQKASFSPPPPNPHFFPPICVLTFFYLCRYSRTLISGQPKNNFFLGGGRKQFTATSKAVGSFFLLLHHVKENSLIKVPLYFFLHFMVSFF